MHAGAFTYGDSMYVLGGFDHPDVWDDVIRATLSKDGKLSAWTPAGKLPAPRTHLSVSIIGRHVFVAGGMAESPYGGPPAQPDVFRARIQDDGSLGEWVPTTPLPVPLMTQASFYYGGYLYVAGGIDDDPSVSRHVWRAPLDAERMLGVWEEVAPMPVSRAHVHQMPVFGNHVYATGGAKDFDLRAYGEVHVGTFE